MDTISTLVIFAAVGLTLFVLIALLGQMKFAGSAPVSVTLTTVGTTLLAVGGISAFLLAGHLVGIPDVALIGAHTVAEIMTLVGLVAAAAGLILGLFWLTLR